MERVIVTSLDSNYISVSEIDYLENSIILIYEEDDIIGSVIWEYETKKWILSTKKLQFENSSLETLIRNYPKYTFKLID